jgi:NADP-dependent 3-hydroxy acid dehydrogenase YdfG
VADIGDPKQCENAIGEAIKKWGAIDILVNNAGVMFLGPVADANVEDWKKMFDINVLGLMCCTRYALPGMQERKTGHIINISSVSGRQVSGRSSAYSATKFAVGAFSDGLRQEVHKDKIRVTVIEPGAVATELTDHITHPETKNAVRSWVDQMTPLTSEDIAAAIIYAVTQGAHVNVNEILIRPTEQA